MNYKLIILTILIQLYSVSNLFADKNISTQTVDSSLSSEEIEPTGPVICKTGIYIKTIRIYEAEETFDILFYYWLRVDTADVNSDYSFISNIEFINSEAEVEVDIDSMFAVDKFYYVTGICKANVPYKADFKRFPFDVQSLIISLESKVDNIDNLVFIPDDKTPPINTWKNNNIEILNGDQYSIDTLIVNQSNYTYETNFGDPNVKGFDTYSRMDFVVKLKRDPIGLTQKILLPLLVVLILAYLVFYIPDYEIGTASGLTVTALLAAIAFQWTLSDSLPKVSYLTVVDKIFYLVYIYIFYAMAQTVYTFNLNQLGEKLAEENPEKSKRLLKLSESIEFHSRYLFPVTFILFLILIVI
jgi:hypothetical protein